ncbi:hypothetical protein [Brevibacillus laterosporus]|uniref:Lipoprotein n=1 Tax=Brevibacillus laterosporus TaxID=1465 RepID=A0AAP3DK47_BRELA|nr:hypothetical protein [Brevibacillus laterosporus]MCR8982595.1 hypothetical protein [Brevibacillus laterosporus]MCZ0809751.1 hypothetical protein [Brevibacillus laterosporus]MCZ0828345.1 hypothetical protein [Brevibacillus laterosporus]MCZ0851411.1 hypothetical protein [Brevibacillus laterosporus]
MSIKRESTTKKLVLSLIVAGVSALTTACVNAEGEVDATHAIKVEAKVLNNDKVNNVGQIEWVIRNESDKAFTGKVQISGNFEGSAEVYEYEVADLRKDATERRIQVTKQIHEDKLDLNIKAFGKLSDVNVEKSDVKYEVIYNLEKQNMLFIQTDVVDKASTTAIIKELKSKYGDKLGVVHFFNKDQKVKKGTKPNLGKIDPSGGYAPGGNEIYLFDVKTDTETDRFLLE